MGNFDDLFNEISSKHLDEIELAERQVKFEKELSALSITEEEYKRVLKERDQYRPSLYDVNLALDDTIVGELKTRLSVFTSFILAEIPTYVSGPSAGGKTMIMEACAKCLMPSDTLIIEGGSDKAIFEQQREIKEAKYIIIREINKVNPNLEEVLKSWGEGKEFIYRRANGIVGGVSPFVLPSKPFIFSRADESAATNIIGPELMSRIVEVTVNGSQAQTEAVMARQAEGIVNPFDVQQIDMVERTKLKWYISNIPQYDVYVNPAGQKLREYIPTVFTTARRDFPKYIRNCEGITRFFYPDRITGTIQGKSTIFVAPQDIFLNHLIFGHNLIQSALRCSDLEKMMMQTIVDGKSLSKDQVQSQLRKWSLNCTIRVVGTHLDHLADLGYLDVIKEGSKNYYSVSNFYSEFDIKPNFTEVVDYCKDTMESISLYEPFADEYIEKFCNKENLYVIDPFTGDTVNILRYDFGSVLDIDSQTTRIQKNDTETINPVNASHAGTLDHWF